MTRKKWLTLRRRRPELKLPTWTQLTRRGQRIAKRMSVEHVIATVLARKLSGVDEEGKFMADHYVAVDPSYPGTDRMIFHRREE